MSLQHSSSLYYSRHSLRTIVLFLCYFDECIARRCGRRVLFQRPNTRFGNTVTCKAVAPWSYLWKKGQEWRKGESKEARRGEGRKKGAKNQTRDKRVERYGVFNEPKDPQTQRVCMRSG